MFDETNERTPLDKVQRLQDGLVTFATGGQFDGSDPVYQRLRHALLEQADIRDKVLDFVRRHRDLGQFWQFIKFKFAHYAERREFIWDSFRPLIDYLEALDRSPGVQTIGETLQAFNPDIVHAAWQKALDRRVSDSEGAITAARTLLESVCKHILDDAGIEYPDDADLPKLWSTSAEALNLAPHQHQEKLFKSILGNCQSVVNSLGALRNKIGDAHGLGRRLVSHAPVTPSWR
jgi:Abortive infection C-terminus